MDNRCAAFRFSVLELVMRAFDAHEMPAFAFKTTDDVATVGEHGPKAFIYIRVTLRTSGEKLQWHNKEYALGKGVLFTR